MTEKSLLILNRKSAARPDVRDAVRPLQDTHDLDVVIPWTGQQSDRYLREAIDNGVTRIIAGGGDGTVNAVVNSVLSLGAGPDISMGVLPLGTANDFARSYGDDGSDLAASMRRAVTGPTRPMDVGCVNGVHFVNVASGGFGAMITATTPTEVKRRLGGLAYTLSGLARLSELTPTPARVQLDDGAPRTVQITALIIGNNRFAGGGFDVAPAADVSDGLLDLAIISDEGIASNSKRIAKVLDPQDETTDIVDRTQFRTAVIETDTLFHLNLDGEPMQGTRFEISVLPSRLRFALGTMLA